MPTGNRVRANNVFGFITDNPLTAGAGAFNSPGLATLPVVASAHAIITLDPMRQFGEPEIVIVTVHTASATVATITRAAYGTVARSHPQNTLFVHAPIDEDVIEIVTSITRPTNPYEGQFVFETDTNKLIGYGGVDWAPRDAGGTIGYAQSVVAQGTFGPGETDLTGITTPVTVGTGRRIRVSLDVSHFRSVADGLTRISIKEGATLLQFRDVFERAAEGGSLLAGFSVVLTPSAGPHTYKATAAIITGTGTITINSGTDRPSFILVEDIGAV